MNGCWKPKTHDGKGQALGSLQQYHSTDPCMWPSSTNQQDLHCNCAPQAVDAEVIAAGLEANEHGG